VSVRLYTELHELREIAEPVCVAAGVPWSVCVAQAWAESGLGRSHLARTANNFHGIKYRKRIHQTYVWHVSPERGRDGTTAKHRMRFASFPSPEAGIAAWCVRVTGRRYGDSALFADDPTRFMAYLWGRGWATADHYVEAFAGRLRRLGEVMGDPALALARIDPELEPCITALRGCYGKERHELTTYLASVRFVWSDVPAVGF
jgi:hypothetical protein